MPTYTAVIDMGGQVYNARAFGATGDGATNDAPAINAALAAARKAGEYGTPGGEGQPVLVPSGIYVLENTVSPSAASGALNLTGGQFNLRGSGSHQTVLRAGAGGVAIDMAATALSTVRDLLIDDLGRQTPSTIGILQARHPSGAQAYANHLYNVSVRLGTSTAANGGKGTVGVYNVGGEATTYEAIQLRADIGLFLGAGNNINEHPQDPAVFTASSPHIGAIAGNAGLSSITVSGTSTIFSLRGPAVRIGGGAQIDLSDTALASVWYEGNVLPGPYQYAIETTSQVTGLRYTGSMENYPRLLKVRSLLTGLFLECYAAHDPAETRIFLAEGAALVGGRIDVAPNPGSRGGKLIEAQEGYGSTVHGMDIDLYQQGIDLKENGVLSGCIVRSSRPLAATKAGIVAGTRNGNVILASDGVHIDGVTPW